MMISDTVGAGNTSSHLALLTAAVLLLPESCDSIDDTIKTFLKHARSPNVMSVSFPHSGNYTCSERNSRLK